MRNRPRRLAFLQSKFRRALGIRVIAEKYDVYSTAPVNLHVWKQAETLDEAIDLANQFVVRHVNSVFNVVSPDKKYVYKVENYGGELNVLIVPPEMIDREMQRAAGTKENKLEKELSAPASEDTLGFDGVINTFDQDKAEKKDYTKKLFSPRDLRKIIQVEEEEGTEKKARFSNNILVANEVFVPSFSEENDSVIPRRRKKKSPST